MHMRQTDWKEPNAPIKDNGNVENLCKYAEASGIPWRPSNADDNHVRSICIRFQALSLCI